ncbi:hypothetical protein HY624_02680 [Candidatus Uhrbacteria bacterium]|nr:hypothetical protein [Candidatus Uhrbacteria bacterium]
MAKVVEKCNLEESEKEVLRAIEQRLQNLFAQADAIAEQQRQRGTGVDMGDTVRRVRGVDFTSMEPIDRMIAMSSMLEQVIYAAIQHGYPIHSVLGTLFGRLFIRIEDERTNRKFERDLAQNVLENLAKRQE